MKAAYFNKSRKINMVAKKIKKARWLFPTNTNNFRMILAQGLLTSPEGFSKYYQDTLYESDGYLPLFNHQVSADSLGKAVSEAEHLVPCLLEFDLANISGQVWALINGETKEVDLSLLNDYIDKLLIPLPMPLGCISKVIFKTKDDKVIFEKEAVTRGNVVIDDIKLSCTVADEKLFNTTDTGKLLAKSDISSATVETPEIIKLNHPAVYAYGGLLSLLFYHAKNGALSHSFFDAFSQNDIPPANDLKEQAIPQFIHGYFHGVIDESKSKNKILKGIVSSCIESEDFKNSLINFLQSSEWDKEASKRSNELIDKLQEYVSSNPRSVSEWFDSAKSDIEKVLLMLFTREDSYSLIDFHNQKINLTEREYLLFAIFFGIRDSFIKVPAFIRKYNGLQKYISNQMAAYAHEKMGSNIKFNEIAPPKTVWQFVNKKLSKSNTKLLSLESCIETIMPKEDFVHKNGKNIYTGYYEPTYEVVIEDYYKKISNTKITEVNYNKLK